MEAATVSTPARTADQRMEALAEANKVRTYRANYKREIKQRQRTIIPAIKRPPAELETMKVFDLLLAAPKVGRVKAMKWLSQSHIAPSKTLAGLSERQRSELLSRLALR